MLKKKTLFVAVTLALSAIASASVHAAEPVVGGDEPGTFKLPGTETSLGFYGYVHVDVIKDLNAGTGSWAYDGGSIGIRNDPSTVNTDSRKGKFNVTAQTSRFGFKSFTPTDIGKLNTVLEGDFVGSKFRLRHAYGNLTSDWGSLLAGQTWSLFRSNESIPETVDFNGSGSLASTREPQVRYTTAPSSVGKFAVAVEVPENPVDNSVIKAPAVTAAWLLDGNWGSASVRAIGNQLAHETIPSGTTDSTSKTKYGFGASVGAAIKITDSDLLQGLVTAGKGISQYVEDANYNKEIVSNSDIRLTTVKAVTAGWQHRWSPKIRTNLIYGHTSLGNQYRDAVGHAANHTVNEAFANVIWSPAKNFDLGLEFAHAQRKLSSGESGKYNRIQTSFHYNF
ncbi:DcaP family trimeric outer membrane transporter [Uliginosibacterium gangwonense]|uniref:DcaP family trimeric outer membrane transporter n=1 Tax=Uliginosibacterium gangwonense TaxID=392736 RepID=UPI00037BE45D|nr:DcaP family trimeric outer membrane transporter [Uliginosibacterium gangwonense]